MVTASEITAVFTQLQQNPRDFGLRIGLIAEAINLINEAEPDLLQEHADEFVLLAVQNREHTLFDTLLNKVGYKDEYMPWVQNWDEGWALLMSHSNRVIVNETDNRDQINQDNNNRLSPPQSRSASPELEEFEARGASPPLQPDLVDLPATPGVNQIPEAPLTETFIRPSEFLYAIRSQQSDIVDAYIEQHGRNRVAMNFTDRRTGENALLIAASTGNQEIIDKLIDTQMFALTYSNHAGQNAAQIAEQSGHIDVAARLLA